MGGEDEGLLLHGVVDGENRLQRLDPGLAQKSRPSRLLDRLGEDATIITPANAEERVCQLSVRPAGDARARFERLQPRGVVADFRPPDLVRLAPVPLYSSFADCLRAAEALEEA